MLRQNDSWSQMGAGDCRGARIEHCRRGPAPGPRISVTFGADIGRIWRSSLDVESKAILTAIRYHGDQAGTCRCTIERIVQVSSCCRSTVLRRMDDLMSSGWLSRLERGCYVIGLGVQQTPKGVPGTPSEVRGKVSAGHSEGVRQTQSPTPPNKEILISPVVAVVAPDDRTATTTTPGSDEQLGQVVEAYRLATVSPMGAPWSVVPGAIREMLAALVAEYGGAEVLWAIRSSVETRGQVQGPSYLRAICSRRRGPVPEQPSRPVKPPKQAVSSEELDDIMGDL